MLAGTTVARRRVIEGGRLQRRHVVGTRQAVVHEGGREELTFRIMDQFLPEARADALHDPAVELPLDDHGVDGAPAVVHGRVAQQPDGARLREATQL